ncbi:MAG: response regulator [Chitinophagaceae bacterium]|nr:response regulator [Chitinophagaceae bacterium]
MKKQILAIDDSKAIRFLLQTVLGKDYQVITAPDGCSAMYWLSKKNLPDLIITDAQLPDMDNWELVEQLSISGLYRDIPMVVLSSLNKNETNSKCLQFGVAEHFTKPFNPIELLEAVNKILKYQEMRLTAQVG